MQLIRSGSYWRGGRAADLRAGSRELPGPRRVLISAGPGSQHALIAGTTAAVGG